MSDSGREWPSEKTENDPVHLRQRISDLESLVERLIAPVSDEEIFQHRSHATNGGFGHKDGLLDKDHITALITARGGKPCGSSDRE